MALPVSSPKLTIKIGPEPGKVFDLPEGSLTLGRMPPSDLIIAHSEVSRQHARLTCQAGSCFLEDLGSANGTSINKKVLKGKQELHDGDEITLGRIVVLLFSAGGPPPGKRASPQATRIQSLPGVQQTVLDMQAPQLDQLPPKPAAPPDLVVTVAGQEPQTYPLKKEKITIGRAEDNDIFVQSMIISRHHACLHRTPAGYEIEILPGATNTLSCQGRPVHEKKLLAHGDLLRIDSEIPGMMVSLAYQAPLQATAALPFVIQFGDKERLTFGRDPSNDVVLDLPNVSRFHTQVTRVGRRYYVTDLNSVNGTYVNDRRISGNVWLAPQDSLRISQYRLVMGEDQFTRFDETQGVQVEAYHLNKRINKNLNLLQDISLSFQPREFVVIVGQSGGGKSTLLDAIAGYRPATEGKVFANKIDIYRNFDAIRSEIGYVPQRDIIHMELTVYQALDFAARLRMPRDTSASERRKRILEVLDDLDLSHRKDMQVSGLSGGQQKRVSIGVELLTRPGLFFLDEPTSGLDPGTETSFMHLMRRLADQGRTILLVTHATKNVMLADKVVFLTRGGYVAWYGPPDAALAYFDKYRSEHDRRIRTMEFDEIYTILDDQRRGKPAEWAQRFQSDPAYGTFVVEPLQREAQKSAAPAAASGKKLKQGRKKGGLLASLYQFFVLSLRNLTILRRDRSAVILMLVTAPAIACLDLLLAPAMGNAPFAFIGGNPQSASISLFLMILNGLLVGGMSQMREFVKEGEIYKRERLVNLRILPYVTSKIWVALLFSFWQALAYTIIHYLAYRMPGGMLEFGEMYVTMVLAVFTGMLIGLVASAIAPNPASAPLTTIMFFIPLIVLTGVLAPIPENVSRIGSTRWAYQSMLGISGMGSDVAADACWSLDKELRDVMTLDDKAYQGCRCMGVQMFTEGSCDFPGTGDFFAPEIAESAPVEPPALPDPPAEPVIPDAPAAPEDKFDQVQMAQYLNALSAYQAQVKSIQENYRNEMNLYQVQTDIYTSQMSQYLEDLAHYNIARVSAVKGAEGIIEAVMEKSGWAYVNKDDPEIFIPWLLKTWFAQVQISIVYFVIILVLIKRKDVR